MITPLREARLRPEFAHLYPTLIPGAWLAASDLGHQLLLWHLAVGLPPEGDRLMSQEHFEFRGGAGRDGAWTDQRSGPTQ